MKMIKKISILSGLSAGVMFFAQDVSAIRNTTDVYGNNYNTGSARYSAMAGSMGALGGDISTLNTNPAGVGVAILGEFSGSLHISSTENTSTLAGSSISHKDNKTNLGQIGGILSMPIDNSSWKFFNIGVNYNHQDLNKKIQTAGNANIVEPFYEQDPNFPNDPTKKIITDYNVFSGHMYERVSDRQKLNIGFGGNYDNKLYIGAGLNFSSADVEQYDDIKISSQKTPSNYGYYRRNNTPFRETSSGFSLSLGVIGKISNSVRVGAAIESPTWWKIDREYVYYVNSGTDDAPIINSYSAVEDRKLSTPTKLTLSGAFIPNKNFAFNVDYRVDLGKPSFSGAEAETQLNSFFKSTYKAQQEVRLGAEYRWNGFRVRGGYAFVSSPYRDYNYDSNNSGVFNADGTINNSGKLSNFIVGKSNTISGGLGYDFKSFFVDATYQHTTYTYTNPFFAGAYIYDVANSNTYSNSDTSIVSDTKTKAGNIILSIGWKF